MDEAAKRFAELAEKFDPKVVEATLGAARMQAFSWLASSALWFGGAAALAFLGHFLMVKSNDHDWSEQWFGVGIASYFGAALCLLPGVWVWLDPWTWTTINHPELWIAKLVFHLS
jgi:hypothetical protein